MHRNETISPPDRVLFGALAIVLATASAAIGSSMTWHPNTPPADHIAAPQPPAAPVAQSLPDTALTQLIDEHRCLSEALYYEARGEGGIGQQAVAEVVFHRMTKGNYGHSICAVVYEGSSHPGCQFSFTCNGALRRPREASAWTKAEQLATQILTREVQLGNATGGATNYHAVWVSPYWAPTLKKTAQIGNHIFYRGQAAASSFAAHWEPQPPPPESPDN